MKVFLMHRDMDFEAGAPLPSNESALVQDLELDIILQAMARGDRFLYDLAKKALLLSLSEVEAVRFRQCVLQDCFTNDAAIRALYSIAVEAIESRQRNWFSFSVRSSPGSILYSAVQMIEMYVPLLERLRKMADESSGRFQSEGFVRFFLMLEKELDEEYFGTIHAHLKYLAFSDGVLISARLGRGEESFGHVLRKPKDFGGNWLHKIFRPKAPTYSFSIHPRDESGGRALGELRDRGVNFAANSLARSADHIESFFKLLRTELAFYVGCANLHEDLVRLGEPTCFPAPNPPGALRNEFTGLYNVCLSLHTGMKSVGNGVQASGKNPVIITGVNEGGKSTLLRSVGVAQLMMQCGMFVPAESFRADIATGIFTHYRRKEDRSMTSGKFDEELVRMDAIADHLAPHSLILFNESFSATNEREGAEIAGQITKALIEHGVRVLFVTHLYSFAVSFTGSSGYNPLFLRAERQPDGVRTFRIVEGLPSDRSHGEDLYRKVFGDYGRDDRRAEPA
jgi:hypothetical protein